MLFSLKKQQDIDEPTYSKLHSTDRTPPAIRGSTNWGREPSESPALVSFGREALPDDPDNGCEGDYICTCHS